VAVSDYTHMLPTAISRWVPGQLVSLGTDASAAATVVPRSAHFFRGGRFVTSWWRRCTRWRHGEHFPQKRCGGRSANSASIREDQPRGGDEGSAPSMISAVTLPELGGERRRGRSAGGAGLGRRACEQGPGGCRGRNRKGSGRGADADCRRGYGHPCQTGRRDTRRQVIIELDTETGPSAEPASGRLNPARRGRSGDRTAPASEALRGTTVRPDGRTSVSVLLDCATRSGCTIVRRLARELGIPIADVVGRGLGGRISTEDVMRHARMLIQERRTTACGSAFEPVLASTAGL